MLQKILISIALMCALLPGLFFPSEYVVAAWVLPDGSSIINESSIKIPDTKTDLIDASHEVGFSILKVFKTIISGFALVYIVLIGAYMVVFSDNEDRIKTQKRQFIYTLVGFLFLNIPGIVYQAFTWQKDSIWSMETETPLWNNDVLFWSGSGFVAVITWFFEIFIFWVAIVTFTWWLFRLIMSGGDEERQKSAKNRIVYGILGLIFLGFVKVWGGVVARWNFTGEIASMGNKFLGLAVYFAGPIAIFFLVMWGYYYITSWGDEERMKKGKSIVLNTFIATLILIWAYSFISDLAHFTA